MSEHEMQGTKPVAEHAWLQNLVGVWKVESVVTMEPGKPPVTTYATETCRMFGPLWVMCEGEGEAPGGGRSNYMMGLGFDVSFKEYRGFFVTDMSSHHWKYTGELSEDETTMTLTCEGPDMVNDGQTAWYRDVHILVDENTRQMKSYFQDEEGSWVEFQVCTIVRAD